MIENEFLKVKNEDKDLEDANFKEAFELCLSIFQNDVYSSGKFNFVIYNSIKKTVKISLKKYGIEAFWYAESDIISNGIEFFGSHSFHPQTLLALFEAKKNDIQNYKNQIKIDSEKKTFEDKKIEENKISSKPVYSIIPEIYDNEKRAIPNVFLRSALFGIVKSGKRALVENLRVPSMSQYEVYFSGSKLDQNDLDVWDSLTLLARKKETIDLLKITYYELCKFMGYAHGKKNIDAIKSRIERLKFGVIKIKFNKITYAGSLIDDFLIDENDGKLVIRFNKKLLSLFENNKDYTIINKKIKDYLGENQLASWLFHFYETHTNSVPFTIDFLKKLSGSETELKDFKRKLKFVLELIKTAYTKNEMHIDYEIKNDSLYVIKKDSTKNEKPISVGAATN